MKYSYIINETELESIKSLFRIVHADETKQDMSTHKLAQNVLRALEAYGKGVLEKVPCGHYKTYYSHTRGEHVCSDCRESV